MGFFFLFIYCYYLNFFSSTLLHVYIIINENELCDDMITKCEKALDIVIVVFGVRFYFFNFFIYFMWGFVRVSNSDFFYPETPGERINLRAPAGPKDIFEYNFYSLF